MQAGEEMLRSKPLGDGTFDHNSYSSPDAVNSIKWDNLNEESYQAVYNYYKGLIAFRKAHPALRMTSADDVQASITAMTGLDANVNAFQIASGTNGEENYGIFVIFNPNTAETTVTLPAGDWTIYVDAQNAGTAALGTASGSVTVAPISAMVLVLENEPPVETAPAVSEPVEETHAPDAPVEEPAKPGVLPAILAGAAAAAAALFFFLRKRKK
jgi:pullulanase